MYKALCFQTIYSFNLQALSTFLVMYQSALYTILRLDNIYKNQSHSLKNHHVHPTTQHLLPTLSQISRHDTRRKAIETRNRIISPRRNDSILITRNPTLRNHILDIDNTDAIAIQAGIILEDSSISLTIAGAREIPETATVKEDICGVDDALIDTCPALNCASC